MRQLSALIAMVCVLTWACPVAAACVSGDCWNGQGKVLYDNGIVYEGQNLNGKFNGQGTMTWPDGKKYVGEFQDNKLNGQGTMTTANGGKTWGEFRNGFPVGQVSTIAPNGTKYVGEFRDGKRNGQGTLIWPNGTKYEGQWQDHKRHGQGTTIYADGRVVDAVWADQKETKDMSVEEFESILPVGAVQLAGLPVVAAIGTPPMESKKAKVADINSKRPKDSNTMERRTALVIGNSAYPRVPLKNPAKDARDMAALLKKLGFDVTMLTDATQQQMENGVRDFGSNLRQGGVGLFYYAGHGVQVAGENYLIPVGSVIHSEGDVKFGSINAGLILAKMEDAGNGLNIVILDACRSNPYARSFRTAAEGLAKMDAPTGSLIAYATAPGSVASDGVAGRNGMYTKHLLEQMKTTGITAHEMFMRVRLGVVEESGKKQVPWESSSLTGYFYFAGPQ